ncbi:hypothetical protein AB3K25_10030 [Leuconostoc sp. MS02]|uniref:Uncharacterized protein n=1 Tax=Leuconostoc aquikimchii TaxID=3236804 RepID=A0ABV3S036_9LACO
MKKIILVSTMVLSIGFFYLSENQVSASNTTSIFHKNVNTMDNAMSDSVTAIELPDGGFLFGPGVFEAENNAGAKVFIDPKTTSYKVTTVGQAKKDEGITNKTGVLKNSTLTTSFIALPTGGSVSRTSVSSTNYTLYANQGYSEAMQGPAWRYAKYLFKPSSGTGDLLQWRTYEDSGLVGAAPEVASHQAYALYPGQSVWAKAKTASGALAGTTFASMSPRDGSYYYVLNQ